MSRVWPNADIASDAVIDPVAAYAILAPGNQSRAAGAAVSAGALLTEHWAPSAIITSHPPGEPS